MILATFISFLVACFATSVLGISVTSSSSSYTVNTETGDGFTTTISRSNCDITSLRYRSTEYQSSSTMSHIASGFGAATVSYRTSGMHDISSPF